MPAAKRCKVAESYSKRRIMQRNCAVIYFYLFV